MSHDKSWQPTRNSLSRWNVTLLFVLTSRVVRVLWLQSRQLLKNIIVIVMPVMFKKKQ